MRNLNCKKAVGVGLLALLLAPGVAAQRQEEGADHYRRWLKRDVAYIITEEEREIFQGLATDEERDAFIEQFWRRRDPAPGSGVNEARQEHYRRIAYANEHFKSGIDGWATDRGRIYILFGPPASIERHPTGGRYERPLDEGGGTTTALPYEVWTYNYVERLGRAVEIEFVDPLGTGEYRIARNDSEKDALLYVGGQGRTLGEQAGLATRAGRIRNALHGRGLGLEGDSPLREGDNAFERLRNYFDLRRPPEYRFPELRKHVQSRVSYGKIPLTLTVHRTWMSRDRMLAGVTIHVPGHAVRFRETGAWRAQVDLYGVVETLGGRIDYEFEDRLAASGVGASQELAYQKKIPLSPGRYKLALVARDRQSGALSTVERAIHAPDPPGGLGISDVVLASKVVAMSREESLSDPFTTRMGLKVYPQAESRFAVGERLAFHFEVYGFAVDSSSGEPDIEWSYALAPPEATWESVPLRARSDWGRRHNALTVAHFVATSDLEPGPYRLLIEVRDRISGESLRRETPFQLAAPETADGDCQRPEGSGNEC